MEVDEKLNILIVDDEPAGLLTLGAILEPLGQSLVIARSGCEALRHLLATEFAVVLLDVQMPEMDGFETAALMRQRERTRTTPILFLTAALTSEDHVFRGYAVGAVDYVLKPVQPDVLRSKVSVFVELARKTQLVRSQAAELRRSERQARELAARAEAESRYKSKFLANMSHELRTPLNAIIGFSELLEQELFGPLNARQKDYVKNVLGSGRHLLNLINDVLDLSKVEAGRMELHREWTSPLVVVDAVRGVVQPLADKQGVGLEVDVSPGLPDVYVDPLRTKQILFNLLSNGIKFTPRGGVVRLGVSTEPGRLVLVVEDTGIGIAEGDLPRLFREFEQIEPAAGAKPDGTGLGLALTKRLVALHGGTVSVASEVGRGSTFTVTLPLLGRRDVATEEGAGPSDSLVLVVEDDEHAAELIAGHLRAAGLSVAFANNADQACELAGRLRPAAITLDILMPGIDGWAVLERLKGSAATSAIPVVVVSVVDEPSRGLLLGATDYLVKPVTADQLLSVMAMAGVRLHRVTGLRVLLVAGSLADDVHEELRRAGCDVTRTPELSVGLLAKAAAFDLVLVDLGRSPSGAAWLDDLAEHHPALPVLALVEPGEPLAEGWRGQLTAVARDHALQPDRLVRAIGAAIERRRGPSSLHAPTGLSSPAGLLTHLRGAILRAQRETKRVALLVARAAIPSRPTGVPWPDLLRPGLRPTDLVAVAAEDVLALVVLGADESATAALRARFGELVAGSRGIEVGPVEIGWYPADARGAEELLDRALASLRGGPS